MRVPLLKFPLLAPLRLFVNQIRVLPGERVVHRRRLLDRLVDVGSELRGDFELGPQLLAGARHRHRAIIHFSSDRRGRRPLRFDLGQDLLLPLFAFAPFFVVLFAAFGYVVGDPPTDSAAWNKAGGLEWLLASAFNGYSSRAITPITNNAAISGKSPGAL